MPDSLTSSEDARHSLLRQISELGDFQPGSISNSFRKCGKPTCHCAKPNDPGHGPDAQLTQKIDEKTVTKTLSSLAEIRKAEREIATFREFELLTSELIDTNRDICRLRPIEEAARSPQEKKRSKPSKRKLLRK